MTTSPFTLEFRGDHWLGRFTAMASPCEVLLDLERDAMHMAQQLVATAQAETQRIEAKFSRYRQDNILWHINQSHGNSIEVDEETAALLDYAAQCYQISEGMFDVTSGVLRQVWRFDGSDHVPAAAAVNALLPKIGWDKVQWQRPRLILPDGMEIDFGGIGKEYAVDRSAVLLRALNPASVLINYGGDLYASGPRRSGKGWIVGVESINSKAASASASEFELLHGGIATSGDTKRFLLKGGIRYGHILDPRNGWPVRDAPHSVTVAAGTCTEAGILSTLAMLHGKQAEAFLKKQAVKFWSLR